jgi:putative spermidine/putrescine transport system substrate-binding protein
MTAGDVNMLALAQNLLAATFKEDVNPNVNLRSIHTGPGEAGSRLIFEKLMADKEAGREVGDVDVAMVHQQFMTWAMEQDDLLLKYAPNLDTFQYVTAADARTPWGLMLTGTSCRCSTARRPLLTTRTSLLIHPKAMMSW